MTSKWSRFTVGTINGTRGSCRWFFEFENTARLALRKAISISPATFESKPEKTISQPLNSSGSQSFTSSSPYSAGNAFVCFHGATSPYFLPAERSEAPIVCSMKWGCSMRRSMKRCPTEPVHPSTPGHCQIEGCGWVMRHTDRTFSWGSRELFLCSLCCRAVVSRSSHSIVSQFAIVVDFWYYLITLSPAYLLSPQPYQVNVLHLRHRRQPDS